VIESLSHRGLLCHYVPVMRGVCAFPGSIASLYSGFCIGTKKAPTEADAPLPPWLSFRVARNPIYALPMIPSLWMGLVMIARLLS
jgi:hypothetical protein